MTQLLLPLVTTPRLTFESLVAHEGINNAVDTIISVYGDPHRLPPNLFVYGPTGTGKTHILHAAGSLVVSTRGLQNTAWRIIGPQGSPSFFSGLDELVSEGDNRAGNLACVAIDDVHLLQESQWSQFWSLWNQATRCGCALIMASRKGPSEVFRDDLHMTTRITSGLVFRLDPPEDQIRMLILDKLARDRQVRISRDVCNYLVTRKSRNVKELERLLNVLDDASLQLKRRITLPLIKTLEQEGVI